MKKVNVLLVPAVFGLGLAACATRPVTTHLAREAIQYRCADGVQITVIYSGHATGLAAIAELQWDAHSYTLKQDVSGSGARYSNDSLSLITKGDEAFIEKGGETVISDCNAAPISP